MFDSAESRLILALDVPDVSTAARLVEKTAGAVGVYKIGMELAYAGGLAFAADLARDGHAVFLDLKLLDIPNTVAGGVRSAARLGARFLTVHAYPQTVRAAVAARPPGLAIVAVTVLTSLDQADLDDAEYALSVATLVQRRIAKAAAAGADAIVCAPTEAAAAKRSGLLVITPGVRLADDAAGDQKRVMGPAEAIAAGADALVVGRPITAAADPRAAARRYAEAVTEALGSAADGGTTPEMSGLPSSWNSAR